MEREGPQVARRGQEFGVAGYLGRRDRRPRDARVACEQGGDLLLAFFRFQRADAAEAR